jgi:hypothetical protein
VFRTNSTAEIAVEEIPSLLCKYLESLALPIIPEDSLQKWPDAGVTLNVRRQDKVAVLKHCLAILNLERCRRDLLMYLLFYMADFASTSGRYSAAEDLASWYGPYICGRNYRQPREKKILVSLIKMVDNIDCEFFVASMRKGTLRQNVIELLEMEKQRKAEPEKQERSETGVYRSLFGKATSIVRNKFSLT